MELAGYWMERGADPERILGLPHEDRLIFRAVMELNREQGKKDLEEILYNTMIRFWNDINRE